jgi:hypothetical protein
MRQKDLKNIAVLCSEKIKQGQYFSEPFQYSIIDDFLPENLISAALSGFPPLTEESWEHSNDPGIEVKSRTVWKSEFDVPDGLIDIIRVLNSSLILNTMSNLLSIPKLMPDPYFSGGGLNVSQTGGHLDVHVDGNYHDASGMHRRVNLLMYLNPNWEKSWGGEFGVYSEDGSKLVKAIPPLLNRCVIFDTHDKSYHGLPNPIKFPKESPRKSIILYYYTVDNRPTENVVTDKPHSALWRSKDFLDKKGNKGRKFY